MVSDAFDAFLNPQAPQSPYPSALDHQTQCADQSLQIALSHPCFEKPSFQTLKDRLQEDPYRSLKALLPDCPGKRLRWGSSRPGRLREDRCGNHSCPRCIDRNAKEIAWALKVARPTYFLTITGFLAEWQTIRHAMNNLTNAIRRTGIEWRVAFHVEANPYSEGAHVHAWVRGALPPDDVLAQACARQGAGRHHAEPVWSTDRALPYGLKEILRSIDLPAALGLAAQATFLGRNGGRLVHHSRGFFLDGEGEPTGLRGSRQAVTRPHRPGVV